MVEILAAPTSLQTEVVSTADNHRETFELDSDETIHVETSASATASGSKSINASETGISLDGNWRTLWYARTVGLGTCDYSIEVIDQEGTNNPMRIRVNFTDGTSEDITGDTSISTSGTGNVERIVIRFDTNYSNNVDWSMELKNAPATATIDSKSVNTGDIHK